MRKLITTIAAIIITIIIIGIIIIMACITVPRLLDADGWAVIAHTVFAMKAIVFAGVNTEFRLSNISLMLEARFQQKIYFSKRSNAKI